MGRVAGKVALVSGAAQGIGAAVARVLAREGAQVLVADVQDERGGALAAALGEAARFVHLDVTHPPDWAAAVEAGTRAFGGIDILVNNAGGASAVRPIVDEDEDAHRRLLDLNLTGTWSGLRAVVPAMARRGGGAIVNVSSIDGLVGVAGMGTYVATKFAVTGLTRTLALEVGHLGIRVNAVHPGIIETPLVAAAPPAVRARLDRSLAMQPIARMGRPEEIANAVLFLASAEASFCTGASLVVDGGHIAGPYRQPTDAVWAE